MTKIEVTVNTAIYARSDNQLGLTWRKPFSTQKTELYISQMITYDF